MTGRRTVVVLSHELGILCMLLCSCAQETAQETSSQHQPAEPASQRRPRNNKQYERRQ